MFYYKVSADMNGNEIAESLTTGEKVREINRKVRKNSTLFNSKHVDTFFAVSEISDYHISIAAISKKVPLTEKLIKEFIEALNIEALNIVIY